MQHLVNVIFGEPGHRCSFTVQQGEYNSREVVCAMWQAMPGGGKLPFRTEGISVMVVYKYGSATSPQYATTICGDNEVCFVIPQHVLAGAGKAEMQLLVYAERSLLKSAIVPFKILDSLNPSAVCEPDVEPELLGILTQVRSVLTKATESEKARAEAEAARAKQFAEWEAVMDNLELQNDVDALEALVGVLPEGATATTVVGYVGEAVAALKIGDYAKAADLEAAIERIAQNETDIGTLQNSFSSLNGQVDELDGFFQELTNTKANKNDLAAIATTGNVNDLVQTEGDVLIFDCGTSAE